ncbi:Tetratricopeptide repeat domain 27 [Chamberlinius hualienensis]
MATMNFINLEFKFLDTFSTAELVERKSSTVDLDEIYKILELVENGELESIFQLEFVQLLLKYETKSKQLDETVGENIAKYKCEHCEGSNYEERELKILLLGAIFLQLFVQVNWTGPEYIVQNLTPQGPNWTYHGFDDITYSKVKCIEYLWLAKLLLFCDVETPKTVHWWRLRFLVVYQELLEDKSPEVFADASAELQKVFDCQPLMKSMPLVLKTQLNLEAFNLHLNYYEFSQAKKYLETLHDLVGFSVELFGALGKRTRFQATYVAQLSLRVEKRLKLEDGKNYQQTYLPKDLNLNDEVRLEKINFKDSNEEEENQALTPIEQAIVIANYLYFQKTNPRTKLHIEELLTYPILILRNPQCWSVQTMALMFRSICESDQRRTIERSMMQLQLLVDEYKTSQASPKDRLYLLHSVKFPPIWIMEKELARIQMQLGVVSSALEIFLRLEMWDDVIVCYHYIQRRDKAEAVIREQLAVKETATLWCCLGDATDDPQYYIKAWEFSNNRCARAQKSLGILHYRKKEYEKSVECLKKSVEINAIQLDTWFRLGFAALQISNWEVAATAYRRCVNLEPENFEAWNNLANVYLQLHQKHRGWLALKEAIKCQYQEPKIWQNYLLVSADLGKVTEATEAYHRILDCDNKYVDEEILGLMVKKLTEDLQVPKNPDEETAANTSNRNLEFQYSKLCELFGRITANVVNRSRIWKSYGDLVKSKSDNSTESVEKVMRLYEKAQRCSVQMSSSWNSKSSLELMQLSVELAAMQIRYCSIEMTTSKRQM